MAIPLVLYAHAASQGLPVVAALAVRGRRKPVPHPRVVFLCCVFVATDVIDFAVAEAYGNNLWTRYVTLPVEVGLVLWTLSVWQPGELLRLTYSIAIPIVGTVVASLLVLTDPARTFYRWVAPFLALLALIAALHTLVHRSLLSRARLTQEDWFWVSLGLSLLWLGYVSAPIFLDAFISTHQDWVRSVYIARAWTDIAAFLLISWGMVCQGTPVQSPGSL